MEERRGNELFGVIKMKIWEEGFFLIFFGNSINN
jgi:hypothetical protein